MTDLTIERIDGRSRSDVDVALRYMHRRYLEGRRSGLAGAALLAVGWSSLWTAAAVASWRSNSTYTSALLAIALSGWLAILKPLSGTTQALMVRLALVGSAVAVGFFAAKSAAAESKGALIACAVAGVLVLIALMGLVKEIRGRNPPLWSLNEGTRRYLLVDDSETFLWFVSHRLDVAARLMAPDGSQAIGRMSLEDRKHVRSVCSQCAAARDPGSSSPCPECGDRFALLLCAEGGNHARS
jgi:hypothetical protein